MGGVNIEPIHDSEFEQVIQDEANLLNQVRQAMDRGELLQGRRYCPLSAIEEEAFDEVVKREADAISKTFSKLGERRSIYG